MFFIQISTPTASMCRNLTEHENLHMQNNQGLTKNLVELKDSFIIIEKGGGEGIIFQLHHN
jgi:hypothetical protein